MFDNDVVEKLKSARQKFRLVLSRSGVSPGTPFDAENKRRRGRKEGGHFFCRSDDPHQNPNTARFDF